MNRELEDVFGKLNGSPTEQLEAARKIYHRLAKITHPDTYSGSDKIKAEANFKKLQEFWDELQLKIEQRVHTNPVLIRNKKSEYVVGNLLYKGDLANIYDCTYLKDGITEKAVFKVAVNCDDNDLLVNEARILNHLHSEKDLVRFFPFIPELIDSFEYKEDTTLILRHANVLTDYSDWYSLKEVQDQYDQGLDPKDMAWMFRRLLIALGFTHQMSVIHGAVLPTHILIHPEKHGLVLVDWSYAVLNPTKSGERISAMSEDYANWYPKEVSKKDLPLPGLDIYMGAKCMVKLLGGDPITKILPESVPLQMRSFFRGCLLEGPGMRPQNAWSLIDEFIELIEKIWGKRRFRKFYMSEKA